MPTPPPPDPLNANKSADLSTVCTGRQGTGAARLRFSRKMQRDRKAIAIVPGRASLRALWDFAARVYAEFAQDRIPTVAGGITFFALLAMFPAIGSVVSLYGMFGHR